MPAMPEISIVPSWVGGGRRRRAVGAVQRDRRAGATDIEAGEVYSGVAAENGADVAAAGQVPERRCVERRAERRRSRVCDRRAGCDQ